MGTCSAAEQDRPDVAAARAARQVSQRGLDPTELVFIDETLAKTNMPPLRGRAPRDERLVAKIPHGYGHTTARVAALDCRGLQCSRTLDGAVDRDAFEAFVDQVLVPQSSPGDMGGWTTSPATRAPRAAIRAAGASLLYLPPYSPDFCLIELAFSKLRQLLRPAGHGKMSASWSDVQRVLDRVTTSDACGDFRHCRSTRRVK